MRYNIKLVEEWARDKGLAEESNDALRSQFIKGVEEGGEISESVLNRDKEGLVDAIGDELVVLTIMCINAGLDPENYIKRVRYDELAKFDSFESAVDSFEVLETCCQYNMWLGGLARSVAKQQPVSEHITLLVHNLNQLATLLCVDIGECYRIAYNVIRDRTGSTVDGVFVKDE